MSAKKLRVLVCGGRDFDDIDEFIDVWALITQGRRVNTIIEGGARGADLLAKMWARDNNYKLETYSADWEKYGKSAGPRRNAEMLKTSKPDLVIAFPGGKGTANMVKQAQAAGVEVREFRWGLIEIKQTNA